MRKAKILTKIKTDPDPQHCQNLEIPQEAAIGRYIGTVPYGAGTPKNPPSPLTPDCLPILCKTSSPFPSCPAHIAAPGNGNFMRTSPPRIKMHEAKTKLTRKGLVELIAEGGHPFCKSADGIPDF